jgi:hypothetical protein
VPLFNMRISDEERELWRKAAGDDAVSKWVRGLVMEELSRLGLGADEKSSSTPIDEGASTGPSPSQGSREDPGDLLPFSKTCRLAGHHWMLPPAEQCPSCGGMQPLVATNRTNH